MVEERSTPLPKQSFTPETPSTTASPAKDTISIEIPPVSTADDAQAVTLLTDLVNKTYGDSEGEIFKPSYRRTSESEIGRLLRSRQLAVAYLSEPLDEATTASRRIVGCLYVKLLSPTMGDFGMLALDESLRGAGLGRQLVVFAEEHCRQQGCTKMQLELLFPTTYEHAGKKRLQDWYLRMDYRIVRLGDFFKEYPHLAPTLNGPADYKIFEKQLT